MVKATKTLEGGIPIYEDAQISLQTVDPNEVFPIANYVLTENLKRLFGTWIQHMKDDCNIFDLNGLVAVDDFLIAPPVVEWCEQDQKTLIVDGIHRFWLARKMHLPITTIFVEGVDPNYPVISFPMPWEEVRIHEKRPDNSRYLRPGITNENRQRFYRDLSVLGSTGTRIPTLLKGSNGHIS